MPSNSINPELDLVFERIVDIPPHLIWAAWTRPDYLVHWFCPLPWKTIACEIDLRPGGKFSTIMQSPEGGQFPNEGCYLELIENQKLVWTDTLTAGYRPANKNHLGFSFTGVIQLEPHDQGTKYTACVFHATPEQRQQHQDMGFEEGWGIALDQLVAFMKTVRI